MQRIDTLHHSMLHLMCQRGRPLPHESPAVFWRRSRHEAITLCKRYEPESWSRKWELKLLAFAGHISRYQLYEDTHLVQVVLAWKGVLWWRAQQAQHALLPRHMQ
eukprot:6451926-Amphidinium_carterae.1